MYQQTMFGLMDDDENILSGEDVLENVKKLYQLFLAGAVKGPEKHEVNPGLPRGSRENYLYFTLPCCINFQRNSPALWQSALDTYQDPSTNYVFFPEQLINALLLGKKVLDFAVQLRTALLPCILFSKQFRDSGFTGKYISPGSSSLVGRVFDFGFGCIYSSTVRL